MFNLSSFIKTHITGRSESLLAEDLHNHRQVLAEKIKGASVMVIGGAGTIGASYIKALLHFKPSRLFIADSSENGLTELTRDLRSSTGLEVPAVYKSYPVNFGDPLFHRILQKEGPFDIVANFAAHKHVRSEKDHYSIAAMLQNNIIYNRRLLDLLLHSPPRHFFCVSTDKAANPVNVMGASKKIMEEVLMAYAKVLPVTTARFANVAFSNGSLLAGFLDRVMKKQPLSAPHDVKRYFVSPEESGQLCLLASILGQTGEIFFPKLSPGSMKTFSSIAVDFLQAWGYQPHFCHSEDEARDFATGLKPDSAEYPLYLFSSNTSGEKLYEEFYSEKEKIDLDRFSQLGIIYTKPTRSLAQMDEFINTLEQLISSEQIHKSAIVRFLSEFLPEFKHIETGISLDHQM